jgi:hypothetical protein
VRRNEYRFQRQSDDSFQFEFLIRLKLYSLYFGIVCSFFVCFCFSSQKTVTEYDIEAQLDQGQFSLATAKRLNPKMNAYVVIIYIWSLPCIFL